MSLIALLFSVIVLALSALSSMRALLPRLKLGNMNSITYFGSIAGRYGTNERARFVTEYRQLAQDNAALFDELAEQVFAPNLIVERKLRAVRQAVWLLALGVTLLALGISIRLLQG